MAAFRCRCGRYIKAPARRCRECSVALAKGIRLQDYLDTTRKVPAVQPRENPIWYWLAIACVIGLMVLFSFYFR